MTPHAASVGVRWWPAALIAGSALLAIAVLQLGETDNQQRANVHSLGVAALAGALLLVWFALFSRCSRRLRLRSLAGLAATGVIAFASLRVRGVTGDLLPIFEWRWSTPADAPNPPPQAAVTDAERTAEIAGLADFPQFLGPARNGVLGGPRLARDWAAQPPELLWRRATGAGWSGFAVARHRAITQEQDGDHEAVVCYDIGTGTELWRHRHRAHFASAVGGDGPRATPTIDVDRVFAQGATGVLRCLALDTGALLWSRDVVAEHGGTVPEWGVSASPLVLAEAAPAHSRVFTAAGGPQRSLVALAADTGATLFGGGGDPAHYSSPVLAHLAGRSQILLFNAEAVAAHDPGDGRVLWRFPWRPGHPHVSQPVPVGNDRVLVSSGYGTGAALLRVTRRADGLAVEPVWKSRAMKAKFTNLIVIDDHVYGLDDGILACVALSNGKRVWKRGRYGHGQVLRVGDLLLINTEYGDVVLVDPSTEGLVELGHFSALEGKTWNPPALAGTLLLVRSDTETACYRLPTEP